MSDETKDLYKLIGDYQRFTEGVLGRLNSIDSRLDAGDTRMGSIEQKIAIPTVYSYHEMIINKLDLKDKKDEEHDNAIGELRTTDAVQEVKLSSVDQAKANAGALSAVYTVARLLLSLIGVHLP